MPILDMPSSCWRTWPTAIRQIMMDPWVLHPGDLADVMNTEATVMAARRIGPSHPIVKEHFTTVLLEASEKGRRVEDYFRETRYEHQSGGVLRGPMSGIILLHVLSRAATGDERISLRSTYEAIAKACQSRVSGAQHKELKLTWGWYSTVSHLWATMALLQPKWAEVCSSRQELIAWLSHADGLRRYGVACNLWRSPSRSTLLDPEQTWRLLPTESLPGVSISIPPPDSIIADLIATLDNHQGISE